MNLVFVYGTLKKGKTNHRLLDGSEHVGSGITAEPYSMYSTGGYPVCFRDQSFGHVRGELYRANDAVLGMLDRLEGHPNFFRRYEVDIAIEGRLYIAWMYFGHAFDDRSRLQEIPPVNEHELEWS